MKAASAVHVSERLQLNRHTTDLGYSAIKGRSDACVQTPVLPIVHAGRAINGIFLHTNKKASLRQT